MKLATWNVNSLAVRLPQVLDWLAANPVDVLVLQETKLTDDKFPQAELAAAGYQAQWFGQKTYNGVALLSRTPARRRGAQHPRLCRRAGARDRRHGGRVRVIGALLPQRPGARQRQVRLQDALAGRAARLGARRTAAHPQLVLMGDFNVAPEDRDVYDPVAWAGQIHCTPEERAHFQRLLALGLVDAFRLFEQPPKSWSWWDYRNLAFRKNQGLRIDHILVSPPLRRAWRPAPSTSCRAGTSGRATTRPWLA
jgi:exodeoxyribonuclease-3